jgi:probable F420-dependent oxidoreductase
MAVRAEEIGFDAVWVYDHLFNPVELSEATKLTRPDYYNQADMPYYDALTTLAVVAGATTSIRLGTRVLLPVLREPVPLAKQIGTLACLAGPGRLIIGVGAGWLIEEFEAVGVDPAERFARLDEHIAVMRSIWSEGVTEHRGTFYRHPRAGFHPVPKEAVPILIGGVGPRTMRRVAAVADGWALPNVEPGPDAEVELLALLGKLNKACELEGRDPATVRLVTGAPLSADASHFEVLHRHGVDDVDLMVTTREELDLESAAEFMAKTAPLFR